jgi:hypothetical protein
MIKIKELVGKRAIWIVTLICVTAAVYFPIIGNDFLYFWDDQWVVMNRYTEGGINRYNLWAILSEYYHGQYAPVCNYYFLFLYEIFGYRPAVFHTASMLLHSACVLLTYFITARLLKGRTGINDASVSWIAFVTALILAVHPVNVESIAWVSAVKIPLYSFFYLAATLAYIRYINGNRLRYYIVALVLFTLSFGCKEQAVTFPVWLMLLYCIMGYSLKRRKIWFCIAPFFALSVIFGIVTMLSQADAGGGVLSNETVYPFWQRIVLASYSFVEYAVKSVFPYNLLYIYPFPMRIGEALPDWMLVYPALLLIFIVMFWKYLSRGVLAAGLTFFLIHIAITLHIIPLSRFAVIADRYVYMASIGTTFIVSYYLVQLITAKRGMVKNILIGTSLLTTLFLGVYSNLRCRDWKNTDTIKKEIYELLRQRMDYVPEEFEKLIENEKSNMESYKIMQECRHGRATYTVLCRI